MIYLISLLTVGPVLLFFFVWWLFFSGNARMGRSDPHERIIELRRGRFVLYWGRNRFVNCSLRIMDAEKDAEIFVGLWLFSFWIQFAEGSLFSRDRRNAFWSTWGNLKSREIGVSVHHSILHLRLWHREHEWNSTDPNWWSMAINLPWQRFWYSTSIMNHGRQVVKYHLDYKRRSAKGFDWEGDLTERDNAARAMSTLHPYHYHLKNGIVQNVTAEIHVVRDTFGFNWIRLPLCTSDSIDVRFSSEVGEGVGSYKGGTTGTSAPLRSDERPITALRRMEKFRRFNS
jgi:hypothetical protein